MLIRTTLAAALAATALGGPALAAQEETTAQAGGGSDCVARLEEQVRGDDRYGDLMMDRQMRSVVEGARSFAARLDETDLDYSEGCGALLEAMDVAVDEYLGQKGSAETAAPSREDIEARAESLADATLVVDFATMVGVDVMNFDGERLGQARAVLIHGNDGPSHLIVQSGQAWEQDGTKGAVAIPFDRVNWDRESAAFYVDMSEQALEKAPEFARADDWSVKANNQWYEKNAQ